MATFIGGRRGTAVANALLALALAATLGGPAPGRAEDAEPKVALNLISGDFQAPVRLVSLTDGSKRLLVAEQSGYIAVLDADGKKADKLFLDLRPRMVKLGMGMEERGLTGLALHPNFKENGKFYAVYNAPRRDSAPKEWDNTIRLSEFRVAEKGGAVANPDSERVLIEIDKPDWNHNSGQIVFGPDGYLYMSVGDGGAPNDVGETRLGRGHPPGGNGQRLTTMLGKMLRIDVDHGSPYAIPQDNPFADGKKGLPEIYAYGLRNAWGISFDRGGSHDLIAADVGQERWEEINIVVNGGNYGWRAREGFEAFDPDHPYRAPANAPTVGPDGKPFIDPVYVYRTYRMPTNIPSFGVCICGGYVYRGKAIPSLEGKYVFADWSHNFALPDGTLLVATRPSSSGEKWTAEALPVKGHPNGRIKAYIWGIGEDEDGELYVLTNDANRVHSCHGKVYKIVAN